MEKRTALLDYKLISDLKAKLLQKTSKPENQTLEFYKTEMENAYGLLFCQMEINLLLLKQIDSLNAEIEQLKEQV